MKIQIESESSMAHSTKMLTADSIRTHYQLWQRFEADAKSHLETLLTECDADRCTVEEIERLQGNFRSAKQACETQKYAFLEMVEKFTQNARERSYVRAESARKMAETAKSVPSNEACAPEPEKCSVSSAVKVKSK